MEKSCGRRLQTALAGITLALAAAACGSPGGPALGSAKEKTAFLPNDNLASFSARELALYSDPDCHGAAPGTFKISMEKSLARFNSVFQAPGDLAQAALLEQDGGTGKSRAVLLACRRGGASAYSLGKTAAVSVELMALLWDFTNDAASYPQFSGKSRDDLFDSALAFVVYHELGHIFLGHTMRGERAQPLDNAGSDNEIEADIFAAGAHARAGYPLEGATLVFDLLEELNPEGSLEHPGSKARSIMIQRIHMGDKT